MADELSSRYEEVAYVSGAFAPSRPDNLHVVGRLNGLSPSPAQRCRVLEIGCAAGGNLLPMAQSLPESRFVGIDLTARQIDIARQTAQRAGLKNVELRCQDLMEFSDSQPFDYIIAHGFYSWVPPAVRDCAMRACRSLLAPGGLAYFSYNTLPGWHARRISRDMMLFHARAATTSARRVARAREIMALAVANPAPEQTPHGAVLRQLAVGIAECPDWYLEHDELGWVNDPVYFEQFVAHARAHGLRYVAGGQPHMNLFQQLSAPLQRQLLCFTDDPVALEQYADFIWGSQYRDSVLCREEAPSSGGRKNASLAEMFIAARVVELPFVAGKQHRDQVRFGHPAQNRELSVSGGWIGVLRRLAREWPHAVSYSDLLTLWKNEARLAGRIDAGDLLANQVYGWYLSGVVELWTRNTDFLSRSLDFPAMTPLARLQAASGAPLINLRHEECRFSDPFIKHLAPLMDGAHDRAALLAAMRDINEKSPLPLVAATGNRLGGDPVAEFFNGVVATLAGHSLLCDPKRI
jgi:SAM-dependent methyltransferase